MEFVNRSIEYLINSSNRKELILPNFQREFIWDRKQNQKPLLTSILFGIPIGSLLILKTGVGFVSSKELCLMEDSIDIQRHEGEVQFLLDGQQRISTLKSIFFDFFTPENWKENYEKIYEKLKTRWFLKVGPDLTNENSEHEGKDIFGWRNLKFYENKIYKKYEPTDLSEIIKYQKIHQGKTTDWFHPEFEKEKWFQENRFFHTIRKGDSIAKEAAEQGLVPLNEVCLDISKTNKLHYIVVKEIAQKRYKFLKEKLEYDQEKKNELLREYPAGTSPERALEELKENWVEEVYSFIEGLKETEIPVILLEQEEMNRAIYTFEFVNRGGTPLDVYDLVVAKAAHSTDYKETLTERILNKLQKEINLPDSLIRGLFDINNPDWSPVFMEIIKDGQLTDGVKNSFLNLLSIFSHCGFPGSCEEIRVENVKKAKQLELTTNQINENTEKTVSALIRAFSFLHFRCGITKLNDLPYRLMILPIAFALYDNKVWESNECLDKIEYWYWSSLFGGAYREKQNEKCVQDTILLYDWIKRKQANPFESKKNGRRGKILAVEEYSDIKTLLMEGEGEVGDIPKAIRDGLLQYSLSKQPCDFLESNLRLTPWSIAESKEFTINGNEYPLSVEEHHVIPLGSSNKEVGDGIRELRKDTKCILNSPLNKTIISLVANRKISNLPIENYIKKIPDLSRGEHFIPFINDTFDFFKKDEKDRKDEYARFLKQRFQLFKDEITGELERLKLESIAGQKET